tara:strand:- start:2397 stop:2834 length:438 start_codon:yes stop_codon:yes gene_type:complete
MVQILDIIHKSRKIAHNSMKNKRLNLARNYLFLTLGSTFIFACIYYCVQYINPHTKSIKSKTHAKKTDIIEDDNTEEDGGKKHTDNKQSFNDNANQLSFFACLLFSLVTQTTVGFAWFVPTDNTTRIIVFFQLISVLCITTYTML